MTLRELVKRKLDALTEQRRLFLAEGGASDYAEYRKQVGFIEGVTLAFNEIEGLLNEDQDLDDLAPPGR